MDFATVTPSANVLAKVGSKSLDYELTFGNFRPTEGLLDYNIATYTPVSIRADAHSFKLRTFWTEGNTDSLGKDVDTSEDGSSAVIRKLNFFVSTAS